MQMHLMNSVTWNVLSGVAFQLRVKYMCTLHYSGNKGAEDLRIIFKSDRCRHVSGFKNLLLGICPSAAGCPF